MPIIVMSEENGLYNEEKTAQLVALLLHLNLKPMNMLKLIKLVYNIDREAFFRWYRPVTFDNLCSMPHGQVPSHTYDNVKYKNRNNKTFWNTIFRTKKITAKKFEVGLINDYDKNFIDLLSKAEIKLAFELAEKYKDKTANQMRKEHHKYSEYKDPKGSSIETPYSELLGQNGFSKAQIKRIESDIEGLEYLASLS